jgi:hypothetical protein
VFSIIVILALCGTAARVPASPPRTTAGRRT